MPRLELVASLRGHTDVVWSLSWSARGLLASCSADRSVRVWHAASDDAAVPSSGWSCVATFGEGTFLRAVRDVAWAADGRSLAAAGFDATAFVLELMGGKAPCLEAAVSLEGHDSEVKGVAYSSSGGLLASCSRDRSVWVWEVGLDFDYECVAVLNGHTADVKMVVWHPSIEMLVSSSYDGTVRVWVEDADDWFCAEILSAHDGTVWAAAFDGEGTGLVTVSGDGSLVVWRREDPPPSVIGAHPCFKVVARTQKLHEGPIYTVDWNKTNDLIATGGGDDSIRVIRRIKSRSAAFKAQNNTTSDGNENDNAAETAVNIRVTSALTEECEVLATATRAHSGDINRVAWHPVDSNILASCGDDGLVRIWRYASDDEASSSRIS